MKNINSMNTNNKLEGRDYVSPNIKAAVDDDDDDGPSFSHQKKPDSKSRTPVLDTYSRDLTKMAEEGKLDAIVGREKKLNVFHKFFLVERRTIQFLLVSQVLVNLQLLKD